MATVDLRNGLCTRNLKRTASVLVRVRPRGALFVPLKKLVTDQALDNAMLKEVASGNF